MLDKIKGGLVGFAIGDAMGVATEFMSPEEIQTKYGTVTEILGGGVFGFECGQTSDDTAMTMAVAKGIIANSTYPIEEIGKQFLTWQASNPKDIGITVRTAFRNYQGDWFKAAENAHEELTLSGGNGTLMRCLPIALAYSDFEKMDQISRLQSKMTHYEDSASNACVIYNRIASRLLNGEDLKSSLLTEIKGTIYDLDYSQEPDCPPNGYVVYTMKWVLYWLLNGETFHDVVASATNKGNDSDTIAAIAGGLKGLEVGYKKLPYQHVKKLIELKQLEEIAEVLYEVRDKDTLSIKGSQAELLQELAHLAKELHESSKQGGKGEEFTGLLTTLKEKVYLYRASLREEEVDFEKKYDKWWNVQIRSKRSRRLLDLGAPAIIVQHELSWIKTEVDHLLQLHHGIEPKYTSEELEELESLREMERIMDDDSKNI